jgi:hypothetical protein
MIRAAHPGSWIPDLDFLPIPDPGIKKALDPGSGSATLARRYRVPNMEIGASVSL